MTTAQLTAFDKQILSGNIDSDRAKCADYLRRCQMASTQAVASYIGKRVNTAAARLDSLAAQGYVEKGKTKEERTFWRWLATEEERERARRRYALDKAIRALNLVCKSEELLPYSYIYTTKLLANELKAAAI